MWSNKRKSSRFDLSLVSFDNDASPLTYYTLDQGFNEYKINNVKEGSNHLSALKIITTKLVNSLMNFGSNQQQYYAQVFLTNNKCYGIGARLRKQIFNIHF